MFCRRCGTELKDENTFCTNCGLRLSENSLSAQTEPLSADRTRNKCSGMRVGYMAPRQFYKSEYCSKDTRKGIKIGTLILSALIGITIVFVIIFSIQVCREYFVMMEEMPWTKSSEIEISQYIVGFFRIFWMYLPFWVLELVFFLLATNLKRLGLYITHFIIALCVELFYAALVFRRLSSVLGLLVALCVAFLILHLMALFFSIKAHKEYRKYLKENTN